MAVQSADPQGLVVPASAVPVGVAGLRGLRRYSLDIWVPAGIFVFIALLCFVGPLILPLPNPNGGSLLQAYARPFSPGHLLGTDALGNDVLSRCIYGGRVSLEVSISAVLLGGIIGGALGLVAGYKGGFIENTIMRLFDMFLAFPSLVLALAIASYLGAKEQNVIFAIAVFTGPAFARLARAATLRVREQTYIVSAKLQGRQDWRIVLRHVIPNIAPQLMTFGLLTVAVAMLIEAALDFLGLGVPAPTPTWGVMINSAQAYLPIDPWLLVIPVCFMFVTVLSLNLLGDALRARWGRT
jgi:peptide/nickel transport system permease protein